jgi:hypothetical protein
MEARKSAGLLKDPSKPPRLSDQEVMEFIFLPVVNEACRWEDGIHVEHETFHALFLLS